MFLPPKAYANILKMPATQTLLNIVPEMLFLSIFVVLNCMWTEIFLRIRKVNREVTRKIFLWSYFVGLAILVALGIILVASIKGSGIGDTPLPTPMPAPVDQPPADSNSTDINLPVGTYVPVSPPFLPLSQQPATYESTKRRRLQRLLCSPGVLTALVSCRYLLWIDCIDLDWREYRVWIRSAKAIA